MTKTVNKDGARHYPLGGIEELKTLGEKMNEQDHRITFMPMFVIQYDEKVICPDSFGDDAMIVNEEGEEVDEDDLCTECKEDLALNGVMEHEIKCAECGTHNVYVYRDQERFAMDHGVFFTAEACKEYMARRAYDMPRNARSYAISVHRSNEMQMVLDFLSALGTDDGTPHRNYWKYDRKHE